MSEKGLNFFLDGLDPSFAATSSLKSQTREEKKKRTNQREMGTQRYALAGCSHHRPFPRNEERPGKNRVALYFPERLGPAGSPLLFSLSSADGFALHWAEKPGSDAGMYDS